MKETVTIDWSPSLVHRRPWAWLNISSTPGNVLLCTYNLAHIIHTRVYTFVHILFEFFNKRWTPVSCLDLKLTSVDSTVVIKQQPFTINKTRSLRIIHKLIVYTVVPRRYAHLVITPTPLFGPKVLYRSILPR